MNERAQLIKLAIAEELAKEGKTLQDLETALADKSLSNKEASYGTNLWEAIKSMFNLYGMTAAAAGTAGGVGLYGAYRANEDSSDKQMKQMRERQQYDQATTNIKDRMNNPTIM